MKLNEELGAMAAGELGRARQWAVDHQLQVGCMFDAEDMVKVSQAHMMADAESVGTAGVEFMEGFAALSPEERRVAIPTITESVGHGDLENQFSSRTIDTSTIIDGGTRREVRGIEVRTSITTEVAEATVEDGIRAEVASGRVRASEDGGVPVGFVG